eukprot:548717_1
MSDSFTMVFVDLDDTLIPTRIMKMMGNNLGINIFDTLSSTLLKKLQYSIIKTIAKIKSILQEQNQQIMISIVSNAKTLWIETLLKHIQNNSSVPKFPILAKYIYENNIGMHSAMDEMYNFFRCKYNKRTANAMIANIKHSNLDKKWISKYTTFSAILLQMKQKHNKHCNQIISFGDGKEEKTALQQYCMQSNIKCNHIEFINSPTIHQLQQQWKYIANNFANIISIKDEKHNFLLYDMHTIFECDNNKYCNGLSDQIWAIGTYFELWINQLDENVGNNKPDRIREVCVLVQKRIRTLKKAQYLKSIVLHLRENKEFDIAFIKQIVDSTK